MGSNIETTAIKACYLILQPIVKILLRLGISYKTFASIAQKVYIDSVLEDDDSRVSASAIAARTGISRKRVGRILDVDTETLSEPTEKLAVIVVIDNWWKHLDEDGKPIHIPVVSSTGLDIKQLVSSAKVDLPFSTVLKLLKKSEYIEIDENGLFYPTSKHIIANSITSGGLMDGATAIYGFVNTIYRNIYQDHKSQNRILFERRAHVPEMTDSEYNLFKDYCAERLPGLIDQFNDWLESSVDDYEISSSPNQGLTGIGVYAFDYSEIKIG